MLNFRYAKGKWTIKEILMHLIDEERIYAYFALRFARGDSTPLSGFDQDTYVLSSNSNDRNIENLLEEYKFLRQATISLFSNIPGESLTKGELANDHYVSLRALVYHLAGHELHHIKIIKEKYLSRNGTDKI